MVSTVMIPDNAGIRHTSHLTDQSQRDYLLADLTDQSHSALVVADLTDHSQSVQLVADT